jgi:hypothetical protein
VTLRSNTSSALPNTLNAPEGKTTEWKSQALRAYRRRTLWGYSHPSAKAFSD